MNSGFCLASHYKRCKANSRWKTVKRVVGILSIVFSLFSTANTAADQPDDGGSQLEQKFFISIPPLNAAEALNRLAKQTGAQLLFPYELALTRNAHSVVGHYAVMEALNQLLQGSGLESSLSNKGAITISDSESVSRANQREILVQTAGRDPAISPYYRDICKINIDSGLLTPLVTGNFDHHVFNNFNFAVIVRNEFNIDNITDIGINGVSPRRPIYRSLTLAC